MLLKRIVDSADFISGFSGTSCRVMATFRWESWTTSSAKCRAVVDVDVLPGDVPGLIG